MENMIKFITMKKTAINPFRMLLQSFLLGALLFSSCNIDDAEEYTPQELGAPQSSVIVPATAGTGKVEVYSNLTVKISVQHGQNWLSLKTTQLKGDGEIDISYKDNEGFPRMAAIYLDADVRKDTIYIKQEGSINPVLELIKKGKKGDGVNG